MRGRIFEGFYREVSRTGRYKESVQLNALAEALRDVAQALRDAKNAGPEVLDSTAGTLEGAARSIELHALLHIADPPRDMAPEDLAWWVERHGRLLESNGKVQPK